MIDCFPRRQHSLSLQHLQPTDLPSPAPTEPSFFDGLPYSISTPSPAEIQRTLRNQYFDASASYATNFPDPPYSPYSEPAQPMGPELHAFNPSIRVQQSTPTPQYSGEISDQHPMRITSASDQRDWQMFNQPAKQFMMNGEQEMQVNGQIRNGRTHRREYSSSSMGSSGPPSPYNPTTSYPYIANTEHSPQSAGPFDGFPNSEELATYSKPLPTPSQTPTSTSFLMPQSAESYFSQGYNEDSPVHLAVKQPLMDHHPGQDDDMPAFTNSARQSVSSFSRGSPVTPRSSVNDYDEFKEPSAGKNLREVTEGWQEKYLQIDESEFSKALPKFDRTMSDAYQDELYNPINATAMPAAPPPPAKKFKPNSASSSPMRKNLLSERLQQAERVRSQSPAISSGPRDSLTGQHLPSDFRSPSSLLGSAASSRAQQKSQFDALAMKPQHLSPPQEAPSTTISPKDALLDYHPSEEDQMPLFPEDDSTNYPANYSQGHWPDQQSIPTHGVNRMTASQADPSSFTTSAPPDSTFSFTVPSTMSTQPTRGYPFSGPSYRSAPTSTSMSTEPNPEFPAHLTSMESSMSDADASTSVDIRRPTRLSADTGTYSCTYHGCPKRFDNPQKLQKHKREGHRSVHQPFTAISGRAGSSDDTGSSGSSMTSEALLARNTQAGPHKCERINPSTGKPCNTIFSRPYDLTRHEDTIHNVRKQKVRCALCVEEKTFSRNDALTRHMRVVHPEVDFPGKHRRRGGH